MFLAPQSLSRARKSLVTRVGVATTGVALAASALVGTAPAAHAATASSASLTQSSTITSSTTLTPRQQYALKAERLLRVVANQKGDPYRYGAAGPNAFDCSGLIYFAFRKAFGRTVPRVANDQKRAARRIYHRSHLRPGDLVFEVNGSGYAYHVGVYAGHGYFWHAPHTGTVVKKQKMYPSHWRYGRLIRT